MVMTKQEELQLTLPLQGIIKSVAKNGFDLLSLQTGRRVLWAHGD